MFSNWETSQYSWWFFLFQAKFLPEMLYSFFVKENKFLLCFSLPRPEKPKDEKTVLLGNPVICKWWTTFHLPLISVFGCLVWSVDEAMRCYFQKIGKWPTLEALPTRISRNVRRGFEAPHSRQDQNNPMYWYIYFKIFRDPYQISMILPNGKSLIPKTWCLQNLIQNEIPMCFEEDNVDLNDFCNHSDETSRPWGSSYGRNFMEAICASFQFQENLS